MKNLCDVCGKPATQSMLRDLFGKSDEMRFVCSDHGFRIRDPADVAAIEQLHAAVKTAQELAATRLMEIERLKKREKDLMDVIDSRDRALGFVPLDEVHTSEPCEQRNEVNSIDDVAAICHSVTGLCCHILGSPGGPCTIGNCAAVRGYLGGPEFAHGVEQQLQLPGPRVTSEDSVRQAAESSRPRELLASQMEPDTSPLTHQEIFSAVHYHAAEIVKLTAAVPAQCTQGASRDASPGSNAWADAKGGLPDNTL